MSSIARCYTPLKTNIYIKPGDQYERRDSFEIDVFQASSYYSGARERALTDADCAQEVVKEDQSMRRQPINLAAPFNDLEKLKKVKNNNKGKKFQPGSPGAKLASYLHSLLNQTLVSNPKKNTKPMMFEDDRSRSRSRSSSMSLAGCVDVAEGASVQSCPTYTSYTRPTPTSAYARAAHKKPGFKDLSSKQSLADAETLVAGGRWPALTWFDQELKIRKGVSYSVKGLKKVKEEDDGESDSSSDLFELQNHDLRGHGELPVHKTTHMISIKARK